MVKSAGRMGCVPIYGEVIARHVVPGSHRFKKCCVFRQDGPKLSVSIAAWLAADTRNLQIVNHPAFIPTAFIVDYKHIRDIGEYVDKRFGIIWVGGEAGLGFQDQAHGSYSGKTTIATSNCELHVVVDAGETGGEHIGLETRSVEKIVLKQLTLLVRFGVRLGRQLAMRTVSKPDKTVFQWLRKMNNISSITHREAIVRSERIWMTWRGRLLSIHCRTGETEQRH